MVVFLKYPGKPLLKGKLAEVHALQFALGKNNHQVVWVLQQLTAVGKAFEHASRMLAYGKRSGGAKYWKFAELFFQHHNIKVPLEAILVKHTLYKTIPPGKMVGNKENGFAPILKLSPVPYFPEMPVEHPAGIAAKKPHAQEGWFCRYHST